MRPVATIAAMPRPRTTIAAVCAAAAVAVAGCGGDDGPEPSIPLESGREKESVVRVMLAQSPL